MTDREKLLELMGYCACIEGYGADLINDKVGYLIANGVTVKKYGRWETVIDHDELWGDMEYYKCSVCGNTELRDAQTPYCPNCGARMDGE